MLGGLYKFGSRWNALRPFGTVLNLSLARYYHCLSSFWWHLSWPDVIYSSDQEHSEILLRAGFPRWEDRYRCQVGALSIELKPGSDWLSMNDWKRGETASLASSKVKKIYLSALIKLNKWHVISCLFISNTTSMNDAQSMSSSLRWSHCLPHYLITKVCLSEIGSNLHALTSNLNSSFPFVCFALMRAHIVLDNIPIFVWTRILT